VNTYLEWFATLMKRASDMKEGEALEKGLLVKCPTCSILHPGIRYSHPDHRRYCSGYCFKNRDREEYS